jgi:hypothetical protein
MTAVILVFLECIYNSLDCGWRSAISVSAKHVAIFATGAADVKATVGRTPWSARVPLDPLFLRRIG